MRKPPGHWCSRTYRGVYPSSRRQPVLLYRSALPAHHDRTVSRITVAHRHRERTRRRVLGDHIIPNPDTTRDLPTRLISLSGQRIETERPVGGVLHPPRRLGIRLLAGIAVRSVGDHARVTGDLIHHQQRRVVDRLGIHRTRLALTNGRCLRRGCWRGCAPSQRHHRSASDNDRTQHHHESPQSVADTWTTVAITQPPVTSTDRCLCRPPAAATTHRDRRGTSGTPRSTRAHHPSHDAHSSYAERTRAPQGNTETRSE